MKLSESDKEELTKARSRIGSNTTDAMHWLVRFAQTRLDELSEGDFTNLSLEIYVFTIGAWAQERRAVITGVSLEIPRANYAPQYAPDRNEIRTFQDAIKDCLGRFVEHGYMDFEFRTFRIAIRPNETRTATVMYPTLSTLRDGFRYHFACLLGEHAHRIGRCIECSSLFVAIRMHQKFCTPRCRSRAGTREFRKAQSLSSLQRKILTLLAEGHTTKDIAGVLKISPSRVESQKSQIKEKLDLRTTGGLRLYGNFKKPRIA